MNAYTFPQKEFAAPETMYSTTIELPDQEDAAPLLKSLTAQYLLRRARRVSKDGTNILVFLTLGLTGLWLIVDVVMFLSALIKEKRSLP